MLNRRSHEWRNRVYVKAANDTKKYAFAIGLPARNLTELDPGEEGLGWSPETKKYAENEPYARKNSSVEVNMAVEEAKLRLLYQY